MLRYTVASLDVTNVCCDHISLNIFNYCAATLAGPVTKLFKLCNTKLCFPDVLCKTHMICPLFNKCDKHSLRITDLYHCYAFYLKYSNLLLAIKLSLLFVLSFVVNHQRSRSTDLHVLCSVYPPAISAKCHHMASSREVLENQQRPSTPTAQLHLRG